MRNKDGTFTKGSTGRPKGAINKTTACMKDMLQQFSETHFDTFQKAFLALPNDKKVDVYLKALEFIVPKLKIINDMDLDNEHRRVEISERYKYLQ